MKISILSLFPFLCASFALKPEIKSNAKVLKVGKTPPMDNVKLFDSNFLFKDVDPFFLREAELKHGRIAMLASLIIPTVEQFTDNLAINQLAELSDITQFGLVVSMFVGEFGSMLKGWENPTEKPFGLKEDYQPGDLGFQMWNIEDPETTLLMDKELNNGRLAMIGALGMICQELATGHQVF
jgi:hypothetical protein